MGWYGTFLVKDLKLAFSLRSQSMTTLYSDFDILDMFFKNYDKIEDDIEYIQTECEDKKSFPIKVQAKMFNIVDKLISLSDYSYLTFLLYFLSKLGFDIKYKYEDDVDLEKLKKEGWKILE